MAVTGVPLCSSRPPLIPSDYLQGDRLKRLDRAASFAGGCWGAFDFVEQTTERIVWKGLLYGEDETEASILQDPGLSYEACPAALLLALLGCGARAAAARRHDLLDQWHNAFSAWNSLPWTQPLVWYNLQDPLVRLGLYAAVSQSKVLMACLFRPEDVCRKLITTASDAISRSAGMSLSVAAGDYTNLLGYGDLAQTMQVITNYPHLLKHSECAGARLLAHLFTARRLLDLMPSLGLYHVGSAQALTKSLMENGTQFPAWGSLVNWLGHGLEVHELWMREVANNPGTTTPAPAANGSMAPFSIWEQNLTPVFSESLKDPVLERIFGLIGISNGYYVEIGTQSGEQCNTRYLRVRYGFHGLMVDDNFQNPHINQTRRFVTPANVVDIFRENDVPNNFDLLSLDTDGFEWLLWLKLQEAGFTPRLVVVEYGENLPFMEDVLVRYTSLPIHRLCLSQLQRFPRVAGGSIYSLLKLGIAWGYRLIHIVACGTSDLIFVRKDVLEAKGLTFPAQDDAEGLCALATYQCQAECNKEWPKAKPDEAALTTAERVLQGDFEFHGGWSSQRLMDELC